MLKLKPFTRGSWSVGGALAFSPFTFIAHPGFDTRILAHMLDSLVRVSRRVNENHFVNIQTPRRVFSLVSLKSSTACCPKQATKQKIGHEKQVFDTSVKDKTRIKLTAF